MHVVRFENTGHNKLYCKKIKEEIKQSKILEDAEDRKELYTAVRTTFFLLVIQSMNIMWIALAYYKIKRNYDS